MTTTHDVAGRARALDLVWPAGPFDPPTSGSAAVAPATGAIGEVLTRYADVGDSARTCVILIDGLGRLGLDDRIGHAPTLRAGIADGATLVAPYPSTTASAIAAFGTGAGPGLTGMLGYSVRDPATGTLGNLVQWKGLPDPVQWQPRATIFEDLTGRGIAVTSIGPARFRDSGMTQASLRGGNYRAAESWYDRIDAAVAALRNPGLAYVHWGDLDKAGHHFGWQSRQWCDELEKVDAGIRRLLSSVPRGTRVLLTADHGMIDVDRSRQWDVATNARLRQGVELTAGEPRALHVHAEPGIPADDIADRWRQELGDNALVVTREQGIESGLFGQVAREMAPRIGDVVVAMAGRATVVDSRTQTADSLKLIGVHGSLTEWEMYVPLLRWDR